MPSDRKLLLTAYPGYGFQLPDGRWQVNVSGVAWQSPVVFNRRQKMLIRMLGGVMHATPEELASARFLERVTPFMADCEPRPHVVVRFGDVAIELEKKVKRDGQFEQSVVLDAALVESLRLVGEDSITYSVRFKKAGAGGDAEALDSQNRICLLPKQGISVITDIDDTIKDSAVGNRRELLHNTFLRDFRSVQSMAQTYQYWETLGCNFHYASASPWQLFGSLDQYLQKDGYPQGTLHLRNFRLRDQLLKKVILHRKGKRYAIQKLVRDLSSRSFILVGDSGEKDPEIYAKICRKFPGNIAGLFIRDLEEHRMTGERWQKICDELPGGICERFSDGADLREKAAPLFERIGAVG